MKSIWSFQKKFEIKGNKYNFAKIEAQVIVTRWREVKKPKTVKSDSAILEERTKRPRYVEGHTEAKEVQANKSTRRMPWHQEPKKDVTSCDKLRLAANKRTTRRFLNVETHTVKNRISYTEYIGI